MKRTVLLKQESWCESSWGLCAGSERDRPDLGCRRLDDYVSIIAAGRKRSGFSQDASLPVFGGAFGDWRPDGSGWFATNFSVWCFRRSSGSHSARSVNIPKWIPLGSS